MRAVSAIALALGAAALALPMSRLGPDAATSPERGEASEASIGEGPVDEVSSGAPARSSGAPPVLAAAAALDTARARLSAARTDADPAGFARALRDLEGALHGLRAGIAGAQGETRARRHDIRAQDEELKRLLAALVSASLARTESPPPLHPAGPVAGARAAALLPASEAELRAGAAAVGARLQALAEAERLRHEGEAALAAGLEIASEARSALRTAMFATIGRFPAGPPDQRDPLAAIARDSDSLSDLAGRLAGPVPPEVEQAAELAVASAAELVATDARVTRSSRNLPGAELALFLEIPVTGHVLRGFEERDGAGVPRPGLTLAAAPRSVVTAPAAGEVRYVGPFLDWNGVVAIAPADRTIVLLAGVAEIAVEPGDIVEAGAPLGFLGGREIEAQEFLMLPDKGKDALGAETLYMELWRAGEPADPGPWLDGRTDRRNG